MNFFIHFLIFAAFGIFFEVIFRAIINFLEQIYYNQPIDWAFTTKIYLWMIPIYGSAYFLFYFGYDKIEPLPFLVQILIITIIIFLVEYCTGFILQKTIGFCPWHYDKGFHLNGLIRLDYTPFWMLFSGILIWLYRNVISLNIY